MSSVNNVLRINQCCCKFSLKTGTMVIAGFKTVASLCYFIFALMSGGEADPNSLDHNLIAIPILITGLLMESSLLYGAIKESRNYMLPWIILNGSILVIICYGVLILAIVMPMLILALIIVAPAGYFWLVVYSYYLSLDPSCDVVTNPGMVSYNQQMAMEETKYPAMV